MHSSSWGATHAEDPSLGLTPLQLANLGATPPQLASLGATPPQLASVGAYPTPTCKLGCLPHPNLQAWVQLYQPYWSCPSGTRTCYECVPTQRACRGASASVAPRPVVQSRHRPHAMARLADFALAAGPVAGTPPPPRSVCQDRPLSTKTRHLLHCQAFYSTNTEPRWR